MDLIRALILNGADINTPSVKKGMIASAKVLLLGEENVSSNCKVDGKDSYLLRNYSITY